MAVFLLSFATLQEYGYCIGNFVNKRQIQAVSNQLRKFMLRNVKVVIKKSKTSLRNTEAAGFILP